MRHHHSRYLAYHTLLPIYGNRNSVFRIWLKLRMVGSVLLIGTQPVPTNILLRPL